MRELEILTKDNAISVNKENGTSVDYFLFDEYEIHLNKIRPHTKQEWHRHKEIEEVLVVTKGELLIKWLEDDIEKNEVVKKGMIVRVKKSIHTLENITEEISEFIVYRMILTGKNNREIIKNDKVLIETGQV